MTYKQKRLKLVWKIDAQSKKCDCRDNYDNCENCKIVQGLGLELEKLMNDNRIARGVEVLKPKPRNTEFEMEPSEYVKCKKKDMLDKDIAKLKGISKDTLTRWKRDNGFGKAK